MHTGKLVFAQLTEHLSVHTFRRCVATYAGTYPALSFSHWAQYLWDLWLAAWLLTPRSCLARWP